MQTTLMARIANLNRTMPAISGKKDMIGTNSSINMASKATATSLGGTKVMSQTAFAGSNAFKESTTRGIVSGMGLLNF